VFILLVKTPSKVLDIHAPINQFVHTKSMIKHMSTTSKNEMVVSVGIDEMKHKVADND
jgi:hypothetical protein